MITEEQLDLIEKVKEFCDAKFAQLREARELHQEKWENAKGCEWIEAMQNCYRTLGQEDSLGSVIDFLTAFMREARENEDSPPTP